MSATERQYSGEPTCRLPNGNWRGSRQVCSPTPDIRPVGAPTATPIYAGEPTCLGSNADVRLVVADPDIAIRVRFVRKLK